MRLTRSFYTQPTRQLAQALLGCRLVRRWQGQQLSGIIVETEAYIGETDLACHARAGRTTRTAVMYGPPGTAYVYFIYGMYWCLNAVTRAEGLPSAVLIRGVLPLAGVEAMRQRRRGVPDRSLSDGPGKLCTAFGIDGPAHHGADLVRSRALRILQGAPVADARVIVTPRIGISKAKDWPLRWVLRRDGEGGGSPSAQRIFSIDDPKL